MTLSSAFWNCIFCFKTHLEQNAPSAMQTCICNKIFLLMFYWFNSGLFHSCHRNLVGKNNVVPQWQNKCNTTVMMQIQNSFWSERQGLQAGIQGLDMHYAAHLRKNQQQHLHKIQRVLFLNSTPILLTYNILWMVFFFFLKTDDGISRTCFLGIHNSLLDACKKTNKQNKVEIANNKMILKRTF